MNGFGIAVILLVAFVTFLVLWALIGWLKRFTWWFWGINEAMAQREEMLILLRQIADKIPRQG